MDSISDTFTPGSSLFSGELGAISYATNVADNFLSSLMDAIDMIETEEKSRLVAQAQSDPSWDRYSSLLDYRISEGEVVVGASADSESEYEIMMVEFGNQQMPPNPLLRSFSAESSDRVSESISEAVKKQIPYV